MRVGDSYKEKRKGKGNFKNVNINKCHSRTRLLENEFFFFLWRYNPVCVLANWKMSIS